MTQDEIIRMAREAGYQSVYLSDAPIGRSYQFLERFAALVAVHEREKLHNEIATLQCDIEEMYSRADVDYLIGVEREACAKVCKDIANSQFKSGETETAGVLDHCAAAIRARSK